MAAGIEIYNYVTNQKGSPAIYSDTLANRPAAGFIGRLFVSTDTLEIYRDNGTTWDLISGGGGPSVNIYNSNGTLTGARTMTMANNNLTFDGGANPARLIMSASNNITRSFAFATAGATRWAFTVDDNETGTNSGGNWYLRAYTDAGAFLFDPISVERATGEKSMIAIETLDNGSDTLTGLYNITGGTYLAGLTMIGGNPHGASHNNYTLANAGNLTFANSIYLGAQSNVLRLQANNSGTITLSAASPGIRTAAATINQIQYNTTTGAAITYTHASVMQTLGFYRLFAAGSLTVTNAYGLIINDLNEYGYAAVGAGALALTNRWGIYQDSTTDVNYFGGTTLVGTTTNAGYKLDVAGTLRNTLGANFATTSGNVGVGTVSPLSLLHINGNSATAVQSFIRNANGGTNSASEIVFATWSGAIPTGLGNPGPSAKISAINVNSNNASTDLAFFTYNGGGTPGSAEHMRITFDGKVGIGTTAPGEKLDVNGNVYIRNTYALFVDKMSPYSGANIDISYGAASQFTILENITTRFRITSGGNVLIGSTTNPGVKLYVNGETRIATTASAGDYSLQNGNAIYTANNAAGIAIVTQNERFQAGEYGIGVGSGSFDTNQRNCINVKTGVAPATTITDVFNMYAADITAGNAAPHFRTENGNIVKIYQQTTGVGSATFASPGAGTTVKTDDTFDGYTLQQIVKALRNTGLLA